MTKSSSRHPGKSIGQRSEVASAARAEPTPELQYDSPREPSGYSEGHPWAPAHDGATRTPYLAAEGRVMGFKDAGRNYTFLFNDATHAGELHVSGYKIAMADARVFADAHEALRQVMLVDMARGAEQRAAQNRAGRQR